MFFNQDIVKNFVNNNVITSHIVGNGNKVINVVNGNTVNNANSKSKEVAKKESSKWEELSTQKEIQAGFEEDIV